MFNGIGLALFLRNAGFNMSLTRYHRLVPSVYDIAHYAKLSSGYLAGCCAGSNEAFVLIMTFRARHGLIALIAIC